MKTLLARLVKGQILETKQAAQAFEQIMTGQAASSQIAAMLAMIQLRGPTVSEIVGAAQVMRAKVRRVTVPAGLVAVDTCGTGGDSSQSFNISTAAAIVAAGAARSAGVVVAKHGNRSVTSRSGSSQVLEALGVKLEVSDETLTQCLDEAGMCFCFAPAHHPAMKHVASIRQELGFRTLFNILGPLTNPASAECQVIGVFSSELTEPIAQVLAKLGLRQAMVVHGQAGIKSSNGGGLDELSTVGVNSISHLHDGNIRTYTVDGSSLGLPECDMASLQVDSPKASAKVIREILAGQKGPARDIVCLNAAAVLVVASISRDLAHGIELAAAAIDDQRAVSVLEKLVRLSQADPTPRL